MDIVEKKAALERKRPYFRYTLKKIKLTIDVDLSLLYDSEVEEKRLKQAIREKKDSGAMFSASGSDNSISSVSIFTGEGRKRKERKISLTSSQGKFLFHLPFPSADAMTIAKIMEKADADQNCVPEILDIVELLGKHKIIEIKG